MRLKKVKIVVQSMDDIKSHWKKALQGKTHYIQPDGVIIFTSLASVAKALSPARLELLGAILKNKPDSIYALAKLVERDFKNVYSDVKILTDIGLVELKSTGKRDSVKPIAKYSGVEIDLAS